MAGRLRVDGVIGSLLDANLGMNAELSGRENIMLRGLYNGMSPREIAAMAEDVAAFAELGEFLELPVRFYSSGMTVRLAFAMATAIKPQILLMDEWFLAGDAAFMDKAQHRLESLVRGADILVLSSHLESVVQEWATRVIWLDPGARARGRPGAGSARALFGPGAGGGAGGGGSVLGQHRFRLTQPCDEIAR